MTKSSVQAAPARPGRGEKTRRRLLLATVELVAEQGWDAVTTRGIAERAGVQQALINYHFGTKEALLRTAVQLVLREEFANPVEQLVDAPSFVDGCVELLRQLAAMDGTDPVVRFSTEAMGRATRDAGLREVMAEVLGELRGQLARGAAAARARGELSATVDVEGTATLLAAIFDGLGLHLAIDDDIDMARAEAALRHLLAKHREAP